MLLFLCGLNQSVFLLLHGAEHLFPGFISSLLTRPPPPPLFFKNVKQRRTCNRSWAMSLIKRFWRASSSAWKHQKTSTFVAGRRLKWVLRPLTILIWALACCSRLSCSDWLTLVKMPASGLKCRMLPSRLVRKCPKLRMQQTRTTHWRERAQEKLQNGESWPQNSWRSHGKTTFSASKQVWMK